MLAYVYDAWNAIKSALSWATAPARQVVAFVGANPKTTVALVIASHVLRSFL